MGCFPENALVKTLDSHKRIEDIRPGDFVLRPHGTKEFGEVAVREVFESQEELISLVTAHGEILTTADQLFQCLDDQYRKTQDLMGQFIAYLLDGKEVVFVRVVAIVPKGIKAKVYHLHVDEPHLYIVNRYVVHNKGGGGGGTSTTSSGLPAWLEPYAKAFIGSYYQQAFGQPFQEGATPSPIARPAGPPQPGRFIRVPTATAQKMGLSAVG